MSHKIPIGVFILILNFFFLPRLAEAAGMWSAINLGAVKNNLAITQTSGRSSSTYRPIPNPSLPKLPIIKTFNWTYKVPIKIISQFPSLQPNTRIPPPVDVTVTFNQPIIANDNINDLLEVRGLAPLPFKVSGKVSILDATLTFTPDEPFKKNLTYLVSISKEITSKSGTKLGTDVTGSFATTEYVGEWGSDVYSSRDTLFRDRYGGILNMCLYQPPPYTDAICYGAPGAGGSKHHFMCPKNYVVTGFEMVRGTSTEDVNSDLIVDQIRFLCSPLGPYGLKSGDVWAMDDGGNQVAGQLGENADKAKIEREECGGGKVVTALLGLNGFLDTYWSKGRLMDLKPLECSGLDIYTSPTVKTPDERGVYFAIIPEFKIRAPDGHAIIGVDVFAGADVDGVDAIWTTTLH